MRSGLKRHVCVVLITALALCPLDLEVVIESIFFGRNCNSWCGAEIPTAQPAGQSTLATPAGDGVESDSVLRVSRVARVAWAVPPARPALTSWVPPVPARFSYLAPAARPRRKPGDAPPPVRGPPSPQV